jgi:hypothetical protein
MKLRKERKWGLRKRRNELAKEGTMLKAGIKWEN